MGPALEPPVAMYFHKKRRCFTEKCMDFTSCVRGLVGNSEFVTNKCTFNSFWSKIQNLSPKSALLAVFDFLCDFVGFLSILYIFYMFL